MKKILLTTLVALTLLPAQESVEDMRMQTMQNLETALSFVQQGLMYNNRGMVANGVKKIRYNASNTKVFEIPNQKAYAQSVAKEIASLGDDLLKAFDAKDKTKVLQDYSQIQDRCISCHAVVRGW